jgi:uncharacterized protein (DUF488 family)
MQQVFTVGHSSQSIEEFIASLQRHTIEVVADVRSRPYSRRFAHFSRESLQSTLKATDIGYVFLGRELGARRDEPECYVDGQAVYDRIVTLPAFAEGINRLLDGARKYRVALMCAEQDPLTCHRTILVCHELIRHGLIITHIHRGGMLEPHSQAEQRLAAEELGAADQSDLFTSAEDAGLRLEQAYARRAHRIAYRRSPPRDVKPLQTMA